MRQTSPQDNETDAPLPDPQQYGDSERPGDRKYAVYVLCVLTFVYLLNYLDRQLLAIVAEDVKADLNISDADLGFLYGTAFAVFYAIFGIPLGRLADIWNRKNLISVGVTFWSVMTALSGMARGFTPLAICRFGVGLGEASEPPRDCRRP
ncbi:MFS transporter [Tsuneonella flava]|uniref:MFS transporter n=1 Tax=Tsuneonella flava TaxID=2055955 RepID=A0ABX7KBY2_9SPHN|nr:MFS transporter [Tsuneonella flava]QSB45789.1 MFS transporter [Tsuneonella flava]